jgi:hypothetical protein
MDPRTGFSSATDEQRRQRTKDQARWLQNVAVEASTGTLTSLVHGEHGEMTSGVPRMIPPFPSGEARR